MLFNRAYILALSILYNIYIIFILRNIYPTIEQKNPSG